MNNLKSAAFQRACLSAFHACPLAFSLDMTSCPICLLGPCLPACHCTTSSLARSPTLPPCFCACVAAAVLHARFVAHSINLKQKQMAVLAGGLFTWQAYGKCTSDSTGAVVVKICALRCRSSSLAEKLNMHD